MKPEWFYPSAGSHSEQWRRVVGLEDRYEVSDLGRVRSIRTRQLRKLMRIGRRNLVALSNGRTAKVRRVDALVRDAFGTNPG
ncbi:NUMOD4 domain-containing protein [Streptomyces lavendulae]|uniref:NUMOD4 domain-containing protein n=1 Tax=Streptomyces lavendulae TaxID=1914 RepID=UPI003320F49B